ncbi:hypothetical protein UT300009_30550 [Paraclostridium bifermentans]
MYEIELIKNNRKDVEVIELETITAVRLVLSNMKKENYSIIKVHKISLKDNGDKHRQIEYYYMDSMVWICSTDLYGM